MKTTALQPLCLSLVLITIAGASAQQHAFRCASKESGYLGSDGTFKTIDSWIGEESEFVVDRETGRILGAVRANHIISGPEPSVTETSGAFIAVTTQPFQLPRIDYLNIQKFSNEAEKPFLYVSGGDYWTGTCKEF